MATAELTNPADALEAFRKEAAGWLAGHFPKSFS